MRQQTTVPRQWLGSCTVRRRCIPCVGTAILESQNRRASPEDHCGRPHLPFPLGVRRADGLLRARHGVDLLADENLQGGVCLTIGVPARAPLGSQHEELAQGMALAEEPTWKLPASGWAVIH